MLLLLCAVVTVRMRSTKRLPRTVSVPKRMISPRAILLVAGENAHSRHFSENGLKL
jgi:hypothetical protein